MAFTKTDCEHLEKAVQALSEFFDTIQVSVSRVEDDKTTVYGQHGQGNLFARAMQAELWAGLQREGYVMSNLEAAQDEEGENK